MLDSARTCRGLQVTAVVAKGLVTTSFELARRRVGLECAMNLTRVATINCPLCATRLPNFSESRSTQA